MTDAEAQSQGYTDAIEALEVQLEQLCPCGCGSARAASIRHFMGYGRKADPRDDPDGRAEYERLLLAEIEKVRARLAAQEAEQRARQEGAQQEREAVVRYLALHAEETAAWASQQRMLPPPFVQPVAHMLAFVAQAIGAGEHVSVDGKRTLTLPQAPPLREGS